MSKSKTKSLFPKEVFITIEEEGTDDEYKNVHLSAEQAAEIGVTKRVGQYTLVTELKVDLVPNITEDK